MTEAATIQGLPGRHSATYAEDAWIRLGLHRTAEGLAGPVPPPEPARLVAACVRAARHEDLVEGVLRG